MIRAHAADVQTRGGGPWHWDRTGRSLYPMSIRTALPVAALVATLIATACDARGDASARDRSGGAHDPDTSGVEQAAEPAGERGYRPMTVDLAAAPEATSLLGEPLYPMILDSATEARLDAQIDSAEERVEARPEDADALIWLGRRYAYAGHYRDAIELFTRGIREHPDDARFYRHRGHRYITVRELDRAVQDLAHAARLTGGQRDRVEPDGMPNEYGIPRSTLQTNTWYHLGLARYLQHDFERATHAFRHGFEISPNDDMRVAMADWLWLALRRLGREDEADRVLARISPEMEILENDAYLQRLLVYKGELTPDSLMPAAETSALTVATHGYGLGAWHLVRGDTGRARATFRRVLETGYWPAFGYIAAEAELRELEAPEDPALMPSARPLKATTPSTVDSLRR